jgi:hypothetical protein
MTKTIFACAAAAVALTACEQQKPAAETAPPPNVPTLAEAEKAAAPPEPPKPAPAPVEAPQVAPPPAKATVGAIVWSIARISVTTDAGIIGVSPGAKLRVVKETDSGYIVSDEKQEFPVSPAQISLNDGAATTAAMADASARNADLAWQRSQANASRNYAKAAQINQAVGELQNRYDQLAREEASLQAGLQRALAEDLQAYNASNQRRVFTRSINASQVAAWKARLPSVQSEKERVFYELKRARN